MHVKIDFNDAISYENDILNSQISIIKAGGHIKNYYALREQEIKEKTEFRNSLRSIHAILSMIKSELPKEPPAGVIRKERTRIAPEVSKPKEILKTEPAKMKAPEKPLKLSPAEIELLEIRRKLEALQS